MNKLNIQYNIEAKIDLFKETCHKFLSKINDQKIMTERLKKDIIKLVIDEVVIDGEKLKISATIPLPNKIHEREIIKTDFPDTFNAGATLGPINQTKMERIWNKHKQINTTLKPKVFVAMSGGVDSSTAAALLKKQGKFDIVGAYAKGWQPEGMACGWKEERRDAVRAAAKIGIPFLTFDFSKDYEEKVVEYMKKEYSAGRTPNPDVMCNKYIKFGLFLDNVLKLGADYIATGHYVRLKKEKGELKLLQAIDKNKDQSYFLWTLTQEQLKYCLFPIGNYIKPNVRKMARKFGLPNAEKKDSQGLCFVGTIDFASFLRKILHKKEGEIRLPDGKIIGKHDGVHFYTIGQRHGLNIAGGPYYIVDKNLKTNVLVVAKEKDEKKFYKKDVVIDGANWIAGVPKLKEKYTARIRYRQLLQKCSVVSVGADSATIRFDYPQRAVTSGQSLVLYKRQEMLGGGVIM